MAICSPSRPSRGSVILRLDLIRGSCTPDQSVEQTAQVLPRPNFRALLLVEPDSEINADAHRYAEIESVAADQFRCVAGSVCRVRNNPPCTKTRRLRQRGPDRSRAPLIILGPTSAFISDATPMKIRGSETQTRNINRPNCAGSGSIICSNWFGAWL